MLKRNIFNIYLIFNINFKVMIYLIIEEFISNKIIDLNFKVMHKLMVTTKVT